MKEVRIRSVGPRMAVNVSAMLVILMAENYP